MLTTENPNVETRTDVDCGCAIIESTPCCVRISCDSDVYYSIGVDGFGGCAYTYGKLDAKALSVWICSPCGGNVILRTWKPDGRCDTYDNYDISSTNCDLPSCCQ